MKEVEIFKSCHKGGQVVVGTWSFETRGGRHAMADTCDWLLRVRSDRTIAAVFQCFIYSKLKEIKIAVQFAKLVRFLYNSITNHTKRGISVAASVKALDN